MTNNTTAEVSEAMIAQMFHEAYERLAPSFGYKTREASAVPWEQVPENNRKLMIAVAGEVRAALKGDGEVERLREALEQISGTSPESYDSDRAWALAMRLRARVALKSWGAALSPPPDGVSR